jgi:hypothetical protein
MANTHEHLEHAEHDSHNALDPFNQRVAVSMAIVAAILAAISMVGHRTHNKVLQLQGDANRLRTEAATAEVEKSNLFAWYQAKRQRQSVYQTSTAMTDVLTVKDEAKAKAAVADWKKKADEYNDPNDPDSLPNIRKKGDKAGEDAKELKAKAAKERDEAEHVHHMAGRFDIAHLAAEIGLVLCSIALLTKKKAYWVLGILAAVAAIGLTASAYTIPHDKHEPKTEAHSHP